MNMRNVSEEATQDEPINRRDFLRLAGGALTLASVTIGLLLPGCGGTSLSDPTPSPSPSASPSASPTPSPTPTPSQNYTYVGQWGTAGTGNTQFDGPWGVALDGSGSNLYVTDARSLRKFTRDGAYLSRWDAEKRSDGEGVNKRYGIAVEPGGVFYLTNVTFGRVQKYDTTGTLLLEWGTPGGTGNGQFQEAYGIAADGQNVYVADTYNHRIQKFDTNGNYVTQWGTQGAGAGQFDRPYGIAILDGTIYVADTYNHRIQKFDTNGNFLSQWGTQGSGEGQFYAPVGVAVGAATGISRNGNRSVFVADSSNYRIQKFSNTGAFLDKWGTQGSANGQFEFPFGIVVDSFDNVYVADHENQRIQKFRGPQPL